MCLIALVACSNALEQATSAGQVVVSVNAADATLSLVSVDNHTVTSLAVPFAGSSPTTVGVLGELLAAPGGDSAGLAVFDFSNGTPPAVSTWHLAANSGATGVAFENDSIAWAANPNRNTVTRINVRLGDTASTAVGVTPVAVIVTGGYVYVLNANRANGVPAGASWITVVPTRGNPPPGVDSIPLTGPNASTMVRGIDGLLYVVDAGTLGNADGKLSIVDPGQQTEVAVILGLGELPGPPVYHPSGLLLIASRSEGILEVNTVTRTLSRGPGNGIKPTGASGIAALALDEVGRVYAFDQGNCTQPGTLHVLAPPPDYSELREYSVGVCPSAAATILVP